MLKEFAEYLVSLKDNKTYVIHGETYSDHQLHLIAPRVPRPERITVNGLDSIVNLVECELSRIPDAARPIYVRVASPREVSVYSALDGDMERYSLYRAVCDAPEFKSGWRDYNAAIIELRSMFVPNDGTMYLLDLLSRITKEDGVTTRANGVTQQVEARSGISLKQMEAIRPRVTLMPYRTFSEVKQPESEFLTRIDENGKVGFFEADGGAWALAAKSEIAKYFMESLSENVLDGTVVVMM